MIHTSMRRCRSRLRTDPPGSPGQPGSVQALAGKGSKESLNPSRVTARVDTVDAVDPGQAREGFLCSALRTAGSHRPPAVSLLRRGGSPSAHCVTMLALDELFVMGLDRDSNLMLRGHATSPGGVKSVRFVGRSFVLANTDFQKVLRKTALVRFSAGPFLDVGRGPISPNWIWDIGGQVRVTALGAITLTVSYGKSLTDGGRAIYVR
jgi:hypothetical protein